MKFNKFLALLGALFSVVYSSFAANIYVNINTGTDAPGFGNAPNHAYKSVPYAYAQANDGDDLYFAAGLYDFGTGVTPVGTTWGFGIDKSLKFHGAGAGTSPSGPARYSTDPDGQAGKETIFKWQNYWNSESDFKNIFIWIYAPDVTMEGITFLGVLDERYETQDLINSGNQDISDKFTFKQNRVLTKAGTTVANPADRVVDELVDAFADESVVEDNHFVHRTQNSYYSLYFRKYSSITTPHKLSIVGNLSESINYTNYGGIIGNLDIMDDGADKIVIEKNVFQFYKDSGIWIFDENNSVDNVFVRYNEFISGDFGIAYSKESNGSLNHPRAIENNSFILVYEGLYIINNSGNFISAKYNHFSGVIEGQNGIVANLGSSSPNIDARGCVWGTAGDGPQIASNPAGGTNKSIDGGNSNLVAYSPWLKGTTADAVPLTFTDGGIVGAGFQVPSPATYVVDDTGPESAPNYVQNAINMASAGDAIELRAADFNGQVVINKALTFAVENAATSLENLRMNGGDLTLASLTASPTLRVRSNLNLLLGKITLGSASLTLGVPSCSPLPSITGNPGTSSCFITNGTGVFTHECLGVGGITSGVIFPLATSFANFFPVGVQNTSTRDAFSVRVGDGVLANGTSGAPLTSGVVNRTWYLSEGVAGGSNLNLSVSWFGLDELSAFNRMSCNFRLYSGGWNPLGAPVAATEEFMGYSLSIANVTQVGPLHIGSGSGCNLAPPTASAPINPVCSGQSLKLLGEWSGPSAVTFSWTGPNSFSSTDANPTIPNATTAASGVYTLTVTASNGCTSSATVNVTVKQSPPTPSITVSMPLCEGQTLVFTSTAIPGASYQWEGPHLGNSTFNSTAQNPYHANIKMEDQGVYSLTVTLNGCTASAVTPFVVIRPTPATPIVFATPSATLCVGQTLTLTSNAVGQTSYSWTGPNSFASTLANPPAIVS